jgi:hypothetical protein
MTCYQAGVGPNLQTLHIYAKGQSQGLRLSLCEAVNIARNYRGAVSISNAKLCKRCFSALQKSLPPDTGITAEMIGVSSIE